MDVGRRISLEFIQKLRTMSILFGRLLIAMDDVRTTTQFNEQYTQGR
jgi:hypothetical protein